MLRSSPGTSPSSATELAAPAAGAIAKDRAGKRKFPPIRCAVEQSFERLIARQPSGSKRTKPRIVRIFILMGAACGSANTFADLAGYSDQEAALPLTEQHIEPPTMKHKPPMS